MENQTCTSYGTYNLNYSVADNERVVAHELAHSWWGNLVGPATWNDIWLNEGFAVFGEAIWAEHTGGRAGYVAHIKDVRRDSFDGPLVPPTYTFNPTVYFKGALVLHMLRTVLGDADFFHALREYQKNYAHGPASTEGLRTIFERTSGRNLQDFFASWVYGTGMPVYEATWTWQPDRGSPGSGDGPAGVVDLRLRQLQGEMVFSMPLPLVFHFDSAPPETLVAENDARDQAFRFRFDREPGLLEIDPEERVLKKVFFVRGPTGVGEPGLPLSAASLRVVPNPARGPVRITWEGRPSEGLPGRGSPAGVADVGRLRLVVSDARGRRVRTLAGEPGPARSLAWDGRGDDGREVPAGAYWIAMEGPSRPAPARVVIVK
jgi:hypothetical protein